MRVAVFSDVHSNLEALKNVLDDVERSSVDLIMCCGDLVGYGPNPNEVIDLIRDYNLLTVKGNYDQGVGHELADCGCAYNTDKERRLGELSLEWTKKNTSYDNKRYLRELPKEVNIVWGDMKVLFVHGSPRRINEYLHRNRPEKSLRRMLEPLEINVLVFGHTHVPYVRDVGGIQIVNVGSVGKPKDGDPRACYSILEVTDVVDVVTKRVRYPIETVIMRINDVGLPFELGEALTGSV